MTPTIVRGPDAFAEAEHRSRFGHRKWVAYRDRTGEWVAERASAESLKRAMLATGTQMYRDGTCFLIDGGAATIGFWWMLNNVRRQYVRGFIG